jgi:receptor expression-enhancing protein 1/2/3/4
MKMIFLLYLALPQTRGSSFIYINYLQPFFHNHEGQIDATVASFKARIYLFVQERIRMLWEHVASTVGQQQRAGQPNLAPVGGANNVGTPPTLGDPLSGPTALLSNLWQSYGPSIVAGGAALLRQGAASTAGAATASSRAFVSPAGSPPVTPPAPKRQDTTESILERRRQLEAELASLPPIQAPSTSVPIPPASSSYQVSSRSSSDGELHGRRPSSAGMRFEEIEVPSDVEGYDVGSGSQPDAAKRTSGWFGWGSPVKETVEKPKSE